MRIRDDYSKPENPSPQVGVWRVIVRLPILHQALTPKIPVEDDPATLARLAAIMSDHIQPCPDCGGDPHICRAMGCRLEGAPQPMLTSVARQGI